MAFSLVPSTCDGIYSRLFQSLLSLIPTKRRTFPVHLLLLWSTTTSKKDKLKVTTSGPKIIVGIVFVFVFAFFFFSCDELDVNEREQWLLFLALGLKFDVQPGPRPGLISANPGLNLNQGFFFLCSKAFYRRIFSILFRALHYQVVTKIIKLDLLLKLSYLNWNFALTLGYLIPALNIPAPGLSAIIFTSFSFVSIIFVAHK